MVFILYAHPQKKPWSAFILAKPQYPILVSTEVSHYWIYYQAFSSNISFWNMLIPYDRLFFKRVHGCYKNMNDFISTTSQPLEIDSANDFPFEDITFKNSKRPRFKSLISTASFCWINRQYRIVMNSSHFRIFAAPSFRIKGAWNTIGFLLPFPL